MTPTMLFLIILAAALLSNSVVVGAQMWIIRSSRREAGKFPKLLHACEPPSFTDDEIEEQIISQQRTLEAIQQLEQRRQDAVARLLKRGVLVKDPRDQGSPFVVRRSPPSAS